MPTQSTENRPIVATIDRSLAQILETTASSLAPALRRLYEKSNEESKIADLSQEIIRTVNDPTNTDCLDPDLVSSTFEQILGEGESVSTINQEISGLINTGTAQITTLIDSSDEPPLRDLLTAASGITALSLISAHIRKACANIASGESAASSVDFRLAHTRAMALLGMRHELTQLLESFGNPR